MPILAAAKPSLIDINFGLMFWTIVSFLIVLFVLKRFAFGPIQATLDERRNAIATDIDAAEHAREEAQSALAEYRQALADSRREATKIIEEARQGGRGAARKRDIAELEAEKNAADAARQGGDRVGDAQLAAGDPRPARRPDRGHHREGRAPPPGRGPSSGA